MSTLSKEFRRQLERVVLDARDEAERGAVAALISFGVADAKLPGHLDDAGKNLRRKLRAHGRQVGDIRRPDDSQEVEHLVHECAYEHWHRMLFARFLAENGFLIEPESGLDVDLDFCEERARETKSDKWEVAAGFVQRMLPGIFRPDNPVLQLRLPVESRNELTKILASLPRDVFLADDSLGWVYQFWQAKKKQEINDAEVPIGAYELAPVTQLFTEDYMVEFLLHNTLGAWWTAKRQAEGKSQPIAFPYLRVKEDGTPAAGSFEGWPKTVKQLRVIDPCMGSGHFLVFALVILVRMRIEEEGVSARDGCVMVLRDNLFGLELDPRCTQIAAFNLALAAWKLGGHHAELPLNLACSGLGLHAKKEDWLKLAEGAAQSNALVADTDLLGAREETLLSQKLKAGMERLYQLFQNAPVLGSLINPRALGGDLLMAEFHDLQPLLAKALQRETADEVHELALTAQGVAKAAEILAGKFTLVATNVPYLGRNKQDEYLKEYCKRVHPNAKADLATCFVERSLSFCSDKGSIALVTLQNWLFYDGFEKLRTELLKVAQWDSIARLGPKGFRTPMWDFNVMLLGVTQAVPNAAHEFCGVDVSEETTPDEKEVALRTKTFSFASQKSQLLNPKSSIRLETATEKALLGKYADLGKGSVTGDGPHYLRKFWEVFQITKEWRTWLNTPKGGDGFSGREHVVFWKNEGEDVRQELGAWLRGDNVFGRAGILINKTTLGWTAYAGEMFDDNTGAIIPLEQQNLPAILAFLTDPGFAAEVKKVDQSLKVTIGSFGKIPFDLAHWQNVAAEKYPNSLPKPFSTDPTQWLFNGNPKGSDHPLQVAVARLVGYRWPRQMRSVFPDCSAFGPDGLEEHADNDGVVCFPQLRDEPPAATRLRALLADSYGAEWSHALERKLITATGSKADSLEEWLVTDFFDQHCELFDNRPFVWHIWDGLKDGFNVLVNYHRLSGLDGVGARTLETLTYAYLGDWIGRQKDAVTHGEAGADDRLAVALELQSELKTISAGEPPYDLFIRWKPLHLQPIGWQPDINDGVRVNIRPFATADILRKRVKIKWDKDRGKEPSRPVEDFPWFWKWDEQKQDFSGNGEFDGNRWNDCHYTTAFKKAAREKKGSK